MSSAATACSRLPPRKPCPGVSAQQRTLQFLAQLPQEALPYEPCIDELMPVYSESPAAELEAVTVKAKSASLEEGSSDRNRARRHRRGKGRRGSGSAEESTVSVWTFNSSGAPQLRAAINQCCNEGAKGPVAILCQEHHAASEQLPDLQAQIRALRWRLAAARADTTSKGGRSAGVGICTPSWIEAGVDSGMKADCSPSDSPGRVASLWIQQVAPGGILLVSCYLYVGEGSSNRNVELLSHALRIARMSGCPWVMGLDAQQEPSELLKWAAPMVDRAEAGVFAPSEPTHFPGVGGIAGVSTPSS